MADAIRSTDTGDDTSVGPARRATIGTSRWQMLVGIIGIVVLLWVGNRMSNIVFADDPVPGGSGPGGHSPVESQEQAPGSPRPVEDQEHQPGGPGDHDPGGDAPPIDGASQVDITAADLAFSPDRIKLSAGEQVNVALTAADIEHDLVVDEIDFHVAADRDETVFGGLVFLEPDAYLGCCSVPGDRKAGMELEIVVTPSDGAPQPTTA